MGPTSTLMPTPALECPGQKLTGSSRSSSGRLTSSRRWTTWRLKGACCGPGWQISLLSGLDCTRPNIWSGPKVEKFVRLTGGGVIRIYIYIWLVPLKRRKKLRDVIHKIINNENVWRKVRAQGSRRYLKCL